MRALQLSFDSRWSKDNATSTAAWNSVLNELYHPTRGELRGYKGYSGDEKKKAKSFKEWLKRLCTHSSAAAKCPELSNELSKFQEMDRNAESKKASAKKRKSDSEALKEAFEASERSMNLYPIADEVQQKRQASETLPLDLDVPQQPKESEVVIVDDDDDDDDGAGGKTPAILTFAPKQKPSFVEESHKKGDVIVGSGMHHFVLSSMMIS